MSDGGRLLEWVDWGYHFDFRLDGGPWVQSEHDNRESFTRSLAVDWEGCEAVEMTRDAAKRETLASQGEQ
jgi:hypothetical protein